MDQLSQERSDERLLKAIQAFVAGHPDPAVRRFRDNLADWGDEWAAVPPRHLPAADRLAPSLPLAVPATRALLALFVREEARLKWEQSYTRADGLVGDDMLAGYGFAEIVGKRGPFISDRVRSGIGVWGPGIGYPPHRHRAEEVYVLLAGSADFFLGEGEEGSARSCMAGDVVHVPSMLTHGFRTEDAPLVVLYIWRGGDLRQKSDFLR